jgi:hypothetical protein
MWMKHELRKSTKHPTCNTEYPGTESNVHLLEQERLFSNTPRRSIFWSWIHSRLQVNTVLATRTSIEAETVTAHVPLDQLRDTPQSSLFVLPSATDVWAERRAQTAWPWAKPVALLAAAPCYTGAALRDVLTTCKSTDPVIKQRPRRNVRVWCKTPCVINLDTSGRE